MGNSTIPPHHAPPKKSEVTVKIDLPDKLIIRMKISQLICEHLMSASTVVRSDRQRSISPSNIAFTLQRPKTVQGGTIQAQNSSTTHYVFNPKDLSTVDGSALGVFRTLIPNLEKQRMFSPGHFFQQHTG